MTSWHFAWPLVLLALPLPWIIWRWLPKAAPGALLKLPHPSLHLSEGGQPFQARLVPLLLALAWVAILVAAARPQHLGPPIVQQHSGRAMLMAVDLSGSMRARDMTLGGQTVNRFQAVKAIAGDFISRRHGDEMGLVLFGSHAYLVTPLTYDLSAVEAQLDSAYIGIAGKKTAIGDAIGIATKKLLELPANKRVLILLTDGVNTSGTLTPQEATSVAKSAGVKIYTIAVGANKLQAPGLFGSLLGRQAPSINTSLLKQIAQSTGGAFFRANSTQSLAAAYQAIDQLEPSKHRSKPLRLTQEDFRLPLIIGLGLLLLAWIAALWQGRRQ